MSITVRDVRKQFGSFTALGSVSLDIPEGELLALLGPSGSGKTTLLRIIAGLEHPDSGAVLLENDDVTHQTAKNRNVGFVFQHYALFRHMTVFDNVAFGLRVRKWQGGEVRSRVEELLRLVRLEGLEHRYPNELSGGQRQRVALARALAARPRVLLLDEPFGALDAKVRAELRVWLRRLHEECPITTIFVTHDQEEAFEVADTVVIMNGGKVEQVGPPAEVFEHPANTFVMDFLGQANLFHGRVHDGKAVVGELEFDCPGYAGLSFGPARVYVRPHELDLMVTPNDEPSLEAKVMHVVPGRSMTRVAVRVAKLDTHVSVELSPQRFAELGVRKGDVVYLTPRRVRVFTDNYVI
ncbi:MAG: sulfate/molybdate ABC transporter ATP-binding protein [Gemmataceae bacterium]